MMYGTSMDNTIEAAASELASIASIVNKEAGTAGDVEEKEVPVPEEELTAATPAPEIPAPEKKES